MGNNGHEPDFLVVTVNSIEVLKLVRFLSQICEFYRGVELLNRVFVNIKKNLKLNSNMKF